MTEWRGWAETLDAANTTTMAASNITFDGMGIRA
jgi:hypothetical protein